MLDWLFVWFKLRISEKKVLIRILL
jgi:hypothetical protein